MIWFMYGLVAAAYHEETGKFWDSLLWPIKLGEFLGKSARGGEDGNT